jgi:hypothetical protein
MADKAVNWDKINADKTKQIQLGQAINIVLDKFTRVELLATDEEDVLKEINTVFNLILDAEARILNGVKKPVLEMHKEVATSRLKLL